MKYLGLAFKELREARHISQQMLLVDTSHLRCFQNLKVGNMTFLLKNY